MRHPVWQFLTAPSRFGRPDEQAVWAQGTRLGFADGSTALCATSGLWNVNLGYGNQAIAGAVETALRESSYLTLFRYGHQPAVEAAEALLQATDPERYGRIIFSTSGGAANDAAMKLARQYALLRGDSQRRVIVGLHGSYHGMTYGSFALSGEDLWQEMYGVDRRDIRHVSPTSVAELTATLGELGDRVAALVLEPVLGMGAIVLSAEYMSAVRDLQDRYGFLVIADEVTTAFGRTGSFLASERWPRMPDVVILSKALTNGTCAAAAIVVSQDICEVFDRDNSLFVHAETQAGSPPSCAAMMATLREMQRLDALARARQLSGLLAERLDELARRSPLVSGVSGTGCFRAVNLAWPDGSPFSMADVETAVRHIRGQGAVVHPGPSCVQMFPALVYEEPDLDRVFASVEKGLADLAAPASARPEGEGA